MVYLGVQHITRVLPRGRESLVHVSTFHMIAADVLLKSKAPVGDVGIEIGCMGSKSDIPQLLTT